MRQTCVHKFQVVIQLGHGANGRTRGSDRVGLVDGNGGGNAFNAVDSGFVHAIKELSCVGRECFHIATLTFSVDGVEGKR